MRIKNYADVMSGIALGRTSTFRSNEVGVKKIIRPQDLSKSFLLKEEDFIELDELVASKALDERIKNHHYLKVNDIIVTARSTSYHVAMVKSIPEDAKVVMNNNLICIRPNEKYTNPEAIMLFMQSKWLKDNYIDRAFPDILKLSVKWVSDLPFTMPSPQDSEKLSLIASKHQDSLKAMENFKQKSADLLEATMFSMMDKQEKRQEEIEQ